MCCDYQTPPTLSLLEIKRPFTFATYFLMFKMVFLPSSKLNPVGQTTAVMRKEIDPSHMYILFCDTPMCLHNRMGMCVFRMPLKSPLNIYLSHLPPPPASMACTCLTPAECSPFLLCTQDRQEVLTLTSISGNSCWICFCLVGSGLFISLEMPLDRIVYK